MWDFAWCTFDSHTDYSSGKIAMLFHASEQKNVQAEESASDVGQ